MQGMKSTPFFEKMPAPPKRDGRLSPYHLSRAIIRSSDNRSMHQRCTAIRRHMNSTKQRFSLWRKSALFLCHPLLKFI